MEFEMNKILLFGLSANPVHNGHLIAAREIRDSLGFPEIIMVPCGDHPFKNLIPFRHRLEMVRIAIKNEPGFDISAIEGERKGLSYTVDTVERFKNAGYSDVYWCIGSDNIQQLTKWHDFERLKAITKFIAVQRPSDTGNYVDSLVPPSGVNMQFVKIPAFPVSSNQIRLRLNRNLSVRYLVPDGVENYIREHRLYRPV